MTQATEPRPLISPWATGFAVLLPPPVTSQGWLRLPRPPKLAGVRCRLRRTAIDRELAAGADPAADECRRRRAVELTTPETRRNLARDYEHLLAQSLDPPMLAAVPYDWAGMRPSAARMERLVLRLRFDPAVRPQGVARARLLLVEPSSPLRRHGSAEELGSAIRATLAQL
jgi:hypothetical protein